jgi:hypothetical protein
MVDSRMRKAMLLLAGLGLAVLVVSRLAFGADVNDLKAANQLLIKAYNSLDPDTVARMIAPGAVTDRDNAAFASLCRLDAENYASLPRSAGGLA